MADLDGLRRPLPCLHSKGISACRQTGLELFAVPLQCLQQAEPRTYFHLSSVERFCDNGAVAVDTQHFKELAIFIKNLRVAYFGQYRSFSVMACFDP